MLKLSLDILADSRYPFDRKRVKEAMRKVLTEQGMEEGEVKISLSVVGDRKIRELKKKYLGIDEITDVLSFPLEDSELLGDIVICYPQAKRQALQWNKLLDEEIEFLACHGLLHLLGVHHD